MPNAQQLPNKCLLEEYEVESTAAPWDPADQETDLQVPHHTDLTQARPCNSLHLCTGYVHSLFSSPHAWGCLQTVRQSGTGY